MSNEVSQATLAVWGGSTWGGVADGSQARPYLTIGAALAAAAVLVPGVNNRICIIVWPGTYVEALTAIAYVDIVGVDRDSCVVTNAVAAALTDAVGNTRYERLTFRSTNTNDCVYVTAAARVEFVDCYFNLACSIVSATESCFVHVNAASDCRFTRCVIVNSTGNTLSDVYIDGQATVTFLDCYLSMHYVYLLSSSVVTFESCVLESTFTQSLIYSFTTGTLVVRGSRLRSTDRHCISLNAAPTTLVVQNNYMTCAGQYNCVYASLAVTGARIENNVMVNGGIHQNVSHVDPVKWVGSSGMKDWYSTTAEALTACTYDDCVVKLLRDEPTAANLNIPVGRIVTIDGNGFVLSAAGLVAFSLTAATGTLTIRNLQTGRIDVAGAALNLRVEKCTITDVMIVYPIVATGSIEIIDSSVSASFFWGTAIWIQSSAAVITIKRSRIKGLAGAAAIQWSIVNNNLNLKEAVVMHGTALAGNNPFSQSGGLGPITYDAHQCAFNDHPDLVAGSIWTSVVPAAQQFHTIDPGADY